MEEKIVTSFVTLEKCKACKGFRWLGKCGRHVLLCETCLGVGFMEYERCALI